MAAPDSNDGADGVRLGHGERKKEPVQQARLVSGEERLARVCGSGRAAGQRNWAGGLQRWAARCAKEKPAWAGAEEKKHWARLGWTGAEGKERWASARAESAAA